MARVTLEDIARLAGVSKSTVSRVLNGIDDGVGANTKAKVQELINDLGYLQSGVAPSTPHARTKTIGLIVPDLNNPFYQGITDPIEEYACERGFTLFLGNTRFSAEKEASYIQAFITKRVDGVILVTVCSQKMEFHRIFDKYNIPCVLLDRSLLGESFKAGVFIDNLYSIFSACEYLIKHGNKRIVFLSGPREVSTATERIDGYMAALQHYSIEYDPDLIKYGSFTIQSGYDCIMQLVSDNIPFDAIMASNDTMAIGALSALKSCGRKVPEQVEIIGFDDIDIGQHVTPPISTISQPIYNMGKKAAELLFDLICGTPPRNTIIRMNTNLILRGTTREDY